jgi:hypothetical protein
MHRINYVILIFFLGIIFLSCNNNNTDKENQIRELERNRAEGKHDNPSDSLAPQILKYDPKTTFAGQDFNLHDGKSVIWMEVKNLKKSVIVVWEGRQLRADKNPELTLLSFVVPKELYSEPGSYEIFLLDTETGLKSKNVYFTVQ